MVRLRLRLRLVVQALAAGAGTDAKRDAIVLNAGVGLYVFGLAPDMPAGIALARKALTEGRALAKLDEWVATAKALAAAA